MSSETNVPVWRGIHIEFTFLLSGMFADFGVSSYLPKTYPGPIHYEDNALKSSHVICFRNFSNQITCSTSFRLKYCLGKSCFLNPNYTHSFPSYFWREMDFPLSLPLSFAGVFFMLVPLQEAGGR